MTLIRKISAAILSALTIAFLTISFSLPALASISISGFHSIHSGFNYEEIMPTDNSISNQNSAVSGSDLRGSTIVDKRVCRYVDGTKRCWDE